MRKFENNIIARNLVEQVQYLTDYHKTNELSTVWGIHVVGQVADSSLLPNPATYDGKYGDTYAVGTEAPFFFYIWTQASIPGGSDYWFPFGEISIVGPQGPQGIQGEKGDTGASTRWYTGFNVPAQNDELYNPGDIFLVTVGNEAGNVYIYVDTLGFQFSGNIKGAQGAVGKQGPQGPQGIQGPQGEKGEPGDVGGFINIWGVFPSLPLPSPASLNNLTVAYLVGANEPYDLYIQVGETSDTAVWQNTGPFNAATAVTVNGSYQNVWDADTKLDKVEPMPGRYKLYAIGPFGQDTRDVGTQATYIPRYFGTDGNDNPYEPQITGALVTANPTWKYHAANKEYVDTTTANKSVPHKLTLGSIYGRTYDTNENAQWYIGGVNGAQFSKHSIACYYADSQGSADTPIQENTVEQMVLYTGTPTRDLQAANKKYVDEAIKLYKTTINLESTEGEQYTIFCNTHRNLSTNGSWITLEELNEQYEGNLNFMLYEHIMGDSGVISFIFGVENSISTSQGTLTIAAKVATAGLNVIEFDKNTSIQITSTPTT